MSVYLKDGMVLLDSGSVATSTDCCCGGGANLGCCICHAGFPDQSCTTLSQVDCLALGDCISPLWFGGNAHCCDFGGGNISCAVTDPPTICCPGEGGGPTSFSCFNPNTCCGNFCLFPTGQCCDDGPDLSVPHYPCLASETCCQGVCCDPATQECCDGGFCCPIGHSCIC